MLKFVQTLVMKRPDIELIHHIMKEAGMVVFDKPFDVTLGGIRTKDNSSNAFNDWIFASLFTKEGIMSTVFEGTTDAGRYYRENPINPSGTAIIEHGVQHRGCYTYMATGGHKGQEAFRQTGGMSYWRDNDKDAILEFDGTKYEDKIFNTNGHDMGESGEDVNKWSAGCWGAVKRNMDILYMMAQLQMKNGLGDKFSYAMLHEEMF